MQYDEGQLWRYWGLKPGQSIFFRARFTASSGSGNARPWGSGGMFSSGQVFANGWMWSDSRWTPPTVLTRT